MRYEKRAPMPIRGEITVFWWILFVMCTPLPGVIMIGGTRGALISFL